jgi:hypothetical protein
VHAFLADPSIQYYLYLLRWTSWLVKADMALMFALLVFVATAVFKSLYQLRFLKTFSGSQRRLFLAELSGRIRNVDSVVLVVPYLGIVGTSCEILNTFRGMGEARATLALIITTYIVASNLPAAVSIVVTLCACWGRALLCWLLDRLTLAWDPGKPRVGGQGLAHKRLSLATSRFSVAATMLMAIGISGYVLLPSLSVPVGLYVQAVSLERRYPDKPGGEPTPILMFRSEEEVLLNFRNHVMTLEKFQESMRAGEAANSQVVYLKAQRDLQWRDVASAIDSLRGRGVQVVLISGEQDGASAAQKP